MVLIGEDSGFACAMKGPTVSREGSNNLRIPSHQISIGNALPNCARFAPVLSAIFDNQLDDLPSYNAQHCSQWRIG